MQGIRFKGWVDNGRTMDKLLSEKNSKLIVEFDLVIHANERDVIWYFDQNKFIIYPTNVLSEKIKCTYILRKKKLKEIPVISFYAHYKPWESSRVENLPKFNWKDAFMLWSRISRFNFEENSLVNKHESTDQTNETWSKLQSPQPKDALCQIWYWPSSLKLSAQVSIKTNKK